MKTILYLVIFSNNHEEKIWVSNWLEFEGHLNELVARLGLPDLIYRKE